jgi:hypothetical protein
VPLIVIVVEGVPLADWVPVGVGDAERVAVDVSVWIGDADA